MEVMETKIIVEMDKILERINGGDPTYINDHNGQERIMDGYMILDNEYVCPIIKDTMYYSINPLYIRIKDNRIHVAKPSVGGTIFNMDHSSPEEAIAEYQKEAANNEYMSKITDYKFF